ncbi:multidrug MFS transporter [Actinorhabdospora filicis]|uniref:Multidrug MFS transporter n=1 Tax=Actinorhabdospora filicis TaxID=1785913 RepID=A0A9W6W585_9ACTN|nr:epoxide hydrolase family protein [Actinorhabdospora filicis]GLZ80107.1 multidrug MFS transporter [Actinorhabdospora filicis]
MKTFSISVPDAVLEDLRSRLRNTRFAESVARGHWTGGVDPGWLREIVAYWAEGFDWRKAEAHLNSFPQYLAEVGGGNVHFVHVKGVRTPGGPEPIPLVLTHGWPSSHFEYLRLVGPLTDPGAHGADPLTTPVFDVVVPSLPGFGFSQSLEGLTTRETIADRWHELMTRVLGYERFAAFGGDIGGGVTAWLGAKYPQSLIGVQTLFPQFPATFDPAPNEEEQAFIDHLHNYDTKIDQGYSEIMWMRPDTIAAALIDSPSGLLAWIADKYRDWTDHGGELESIWDRDSLLTVVTLYWVTGTIGESFRQYHDYDLMNPRPVTTVPTAVALSNEPGTQGAPRSIAARSTTDLRRWSRPERGGHFFAFEQPELAAGEIRAFFGSL